jgi:hypothetical protein
MYSRVDFLFHDRCSKEHYVDNPATIKREHIH